MTTEKMKALVRDGNSVAVRALPQSALLKQDDVVVRVMLAGLCRTDLYAAEGKIKTANPLILGHEFSGIVTEVGSDVEQVAAGDRVTVNPVIPCGKCKYCNNGTAAGCQRYEFLGVDRNGCFAGYITVPASAIYRLAHGVSFMAAAYAEPVAASLAVLKTGIQPEERGIIFGNNRFSQLMEKILRVHGFNNVAVYDPLNEEDSFEREAFDFVIETMVSTETLSDMVEAARPGARIILKSRQYEPILLRLNSIIRKEPVFHVVNYGSFEEAVGLLVSGRVQVDDLVDGVYPLEDFEVVLKRAGQKESLKPFFAPWDD